MKNQKSSSFSRKETNESLSSFKCKANDFNKYQKYDSNLNANANEVFTGICKNEKHNNELEFFCKTHNILCCSSCITKVKDKYHGQHTDCDVCLIQDVMGEKKNKLKNSIKYLEDLSISIEDSIKQLKIISESINSSKEELKKNIKEIFIKIKNALNIRENELLFEVDEKFNGLFSNEKFISKIEKLPNQIKFSLEKGKLIDKVWDNENKLNLLINNCINIENDIKDINIINKEIIYNSSINLNVKFLLNKESEIDKFLENIKSFGKIESSFNNLQPIEEKKEQNKIIEEKSVFDRDNDNKNKNVDINEKILNNNKEIINNKINDIAIYNNKNEDKKEDIEFKHILEQYFNNENGDLNKKKVTEDDLNQIEEYYKSLLDKNKNIEDIREYQSKYIELEINPQLKKITRPRFKEYIQQRINKINKIFYKLK